MLKCTVALRLSQSQLHDYTIYYIGGKSVLSIPVYYTFLYYDLTRLKHCAFVDFNMNKMAKCCNIALRKRRTFAYNVDLMTGN